LKIVASILPAIRGVSGLHYPISLLWVKLGCIVLVHPIRIGLGNRFVWDLSSTWNKDRL